MESLTIAAFIVATMALALTLMVAPVVGYVIWKYVYAPWRVMRADIAALNQKLATVEQSARVKTISDEEAARVEARLNARERYRHGVPS